MNPLHQFPRVRRALYFVQWFVNLVLGAIAVVLLIREQSPQWFIITGAVFNFIWSYTGITAQANVAVSGNPAPVHEDDDPEDGLVFGDPHGWEGSE